MHFLYFFMFFFRFVFRVCCERPCEQLYIPKLRCVLCFFSDLFSVCVASVPASNFVYQNCDLFGPPCDQEVPLFRCFSSDLQYQNCDVQVLGEQLPVPILRLSGALRASLLGRALYYSHFVRALIFFVFIRKSPCLVLFSHWDPLLVGA